MGELRRSLDSYARADSDRKAALREEYLGLLHLPSLGITHGTRLHMAKIGEGGCASVHRVRCDDDGRIFALKTIEGGRAEDRVRNMMYLRKELEYMMNMGPHPSQYCQGGGGMGCE